jgi:hypothetical protein
MAISSNFPSIRPSLLLDFASVGRLDPRVTFTRASSGTYYDGVTTAKAEQNLVLQSQDFTTSWTNVNSTDTADTTVAPDGTTTADTITDNATNGTHAVTQSVPIVINTDFTFSCFLKAGTSNYGFISVVDDTATERYFIADFDLSSGTVRTSGAGTSGTLTSSSVTEFPSGSGWYRCVIVGQISVLGSSTANYRVKVGVSDGTSAIGSFGTIPYAGTGSTIIAWGAQLEQRSAVTAYTATTTQSITNYIPVLQTAAAGVPRFDHNPTTGEALGLLIEEQRTNLLLQSGWAGATSGTPGSAPTSWTVGFGTNTVTTAYPSYFDTSANAVKFDCDSGERVMFQQSINVTNGVQYALSAYLEAVSGSIGDGLLVIAGTATLTQNTFVTNPSTPGRYTILFTATGTGTVTVRVGVGTSATVSATCSATWSHPQIEAGAFSTSYIPTTTASVTRNADVASMTGTNFSSWFNAGEGTVYSEHQSVSAPNLRAYCISDGTSNNALQNVVTTSGGTGVRFEVRVNNSATAFVPGTAITPVAGQFYKLAAAYKFNDVAASRDGEAAGTDTSADLPVVDRIFIGARASGANELNGTIRKLAYYPQRLTNAQLQALTG